MDEMKKISYIILTWNSEKYINDCIESILEIDNFINDIIVIDNGSIDKTTEILEKLDKTISNLEVIYLDKNIGTTKSRNLGLKRVKTDTDYICILDSDTVINKEAILIMTNYLKDNKSVGIVGPTMIGKNNEKQISYRKFPTWKIKICKAVPVKSINKKGEELESYNVEKMLNAFECDYLISACWIMRYSLYEELGGFDENIFYSPEDVEYCMRVRQAGYNVVYLVKANIIHYYQRISKKKLISKVNLSHLLGINYVLHKYKKFLKQYQRRGEEK